MRRLMLVFSIVIGILLVLGCDGGNPSNNPEFIIRPADASSPVGFQRQFTIAQASRSVLIFEGFRGVKWESSDPTVATITSSGLATALTPGTTTISASGTTQNGAKFSATSRLTVTSAAVLDIKIMPNPASVPAGLEQQFTVTAQMSDGSSIDITKVVALVWSSDNPSVAIIDSGGKVKAQAPGMATITATAKIADGKYLSATAGLTVTSAVVTALSITPKSASTPAGLERQFAAIASISDGSQFDVTDNSLVTWQSSEPSVANITAPGRARSISPGATTITATGQSPNGKVFTSSAELLVESAIVERIELTPQNCSEPANYICEFDVVAILTDGSSELIDRNVVDWEAEPASLAKFASAGRLQLLAEGEVTVTATLGVDGNLFAISGNVTILPGTVVKVVDVGTGLVVGPYGLACLGDGIFTSQYDPGCVNYRFDLPQFGWSPQETYFTIQFPQKLTLASLSNMAYWRQNLSGAFGNWQVFACADETIACTERVAVSIATPWAAGQDKVDANATIKVSTGGAQYATYRLVFVGGDVQPNGGSGTGSFSELFYTARRPR